MKTTQTLGLGLILAAVSLLVTGCEQHAQTAIETMPATTDQTHFTKEVTLENFESLVLNSDQPVVVDFWAAWCGPCIQLSPTIEKLAQNYDGKFVVGKLNTEEQQAIAIKYQVDEIPALLYFKNGKLVKKHVGFASYGDLEVDFEEVLAMTPET